MPPKKKDKKGEAEAKRWSFHDDNDGGGADYHQRGES